jgi:hypothetical protein
VSDQGNMGSCLMPDMETIINYMQRGMKMKMYMKLVKTIDAYKRCVANGNEEWELIHKQTIDDIINSLPHGSGIDGITTVNFDKCSDKMIWLNSSYHAMDEYGMYDRWIDFSIVITASLLFGFDLHVYGRFGKYSDAKDWIMDVFGQDFEKEVQE